MNNIDPKKLAEDVAMLLDYKMSVGGVDKTVRDLITLLGEAHEALQLCRPEHVTRPMLARLEPIVKLMEKK